MNEEVACLLKKPFRTTMSYTGGASKAVLNLSRRLQSTDFSAEQLYTNFSFKFLETKKKRKKNSIVKMSSNERDPLEEPPPSTQVSQPSNRNYAAVLLFTYDIDNDQPFISVPLNHFEGSDFPLDVINGHMGLSDRLKPRQLSGLPGSKYCIFAKCEEGTFFCINFFGQL